MKILGILEKPYVSNKIEEPKNIFIKPDTIRLSYSIKEQLSKWTYNLYRIEILTDKEINKILKIELPDSTYYSTGGYEVSDEYQLIDIEDIGNNEILVTIKSDKGRAWGTIMNYSLIESLDFTMNILTLINKSDKVYKLQTEDPDKLKKISKVLSTFKELRKK